MHYQIYLPGKKTCAKKDLIEVGLEDHLPGCDRKSNEGGPDGKGGSYCAWLSPGNARIGYYPDEQTWIPALPSGGLAAGRYYVGFWNDLPPSPEELQHPTIFDGYYIQLDDGHDWAIPAAARLPQTIKLDDEGEVTRIVKKQFREFWDASIRAYQFFIDCDPKADTIEVDSAWWDYLLMALRLNYRVTPEVVSHLGLFSDSTAVKSILATCQGQAIIAVNRDLAEKKTAEPAAIPAG